MDSGWTLTSSSSLFSGQSLHRLFSRVPSMALQKRSPSCSQAFFSFFLPHRGRTPFPEADVTRWQIVLNSPFSWVGTWSASPAEMRDGILPTPLPPLPEDQDLVEILEKPFAPFRRPTAFRSLTDFPPPLTKVCRLLFRRSFQG